MLETPKALEANNRACKSRGETAWFQTSGALRLSLGYFNVEIPIQKVMFVFEDAVDEQFAELSKNFAWYRDTKELWTELYSWADADVKHVYVILRRLRSSP